MPRWRVLRLAAVHDRDASDRFLPPNTLYLRAPVLVRSRFIVRTCALRISDGFYPSEPRNRAFSRRPNRFVDRRARGGVFVPIPRNPIWVRDPERPTLTPLSLPPLRAYSAISRKVTRGEGCQGRFHTARRDARDVFSTQGAFPRQVIPDSACPLQVTDREIIAGPVTLHITFPTLGFLSPPASPARACDAAGLPLVSAGTRRARVLLARIIIRGLGPRSRHSPCLRKTSGE
jgi:hypothetical protein